MMIEKTAPSECEVCDTKQADLQAKEPKQTLRVYLGMWICPTCEHKERALQQAANSPEAIQARVQASQNVIEQARLIDSRIQVIDDIHNAQTLAIVELMKAIDANPEIENKPLAKATELHTRFTHLSKVMFDARQELINAGNEQRAIQQYMNTLANQLRAEEREKLKLQDINYTPDIVKPVKVRKETTSTKSRGPKKFDKEALRKACEEFKVPMDVVQIMVVSKNMSPADAAKHVAKMMGL